MSGRESSGTARCAGEPVSWLVLERYHLGELSDAERDAVARHLVECPACGACLAQIDADDGIALPPLTVSAAKGAGRDSGRDRERARHGDVARDRRDRTVWAGCMGALAAAAVATLVVGRSAPERIDGPREGNGRIKGGDVAFALVRDDGQRFEDVEGVFRAGDRFKAVVSCPVSERTWFDLVVFDAEGASFPLAPFQGTACGNGVPLPGAFRLTGSARESVCLVWSDDGAVDREGLSRAGIAFALHASPGPQGAQAAQASCKELAPADER